MVIAVVQFLALVGSGQSLPATAAPADMLPIAAPASDAQRALTPEDLVRLRDIGPAHAGPFDARLFTLSPDGRYAAFQLRRADLGTNDYQLAMIVVSIEGGMPPRIVDHGGELLRVRFDFRGKADFPSGVPAVITPYWSPDGNWIAFLKRTGGRTQVWQARTDGSGSGPLTSGTDDVEDFRVLADGSIVYATRPGLRAAQAAIFREGRVGYHYDDRFAPMSGTRPFPPAPIPRLIQVQERKGGRVRSATDAEAARLRARDGSHDEVWSSSRAAHGRRTWIETPDPAIGGSRLMADGARGTAIACADPACESASRPWWSPDGVRVLYLRREGWARGSTAIYAWEPGVAPPERLHITDDLLVDCAPQGGALLCLREGSLTPRRLERLDLTTGHRTILFDPNPEMAGLRLGKVERLQWRNDYGLEAIGDLVLPVDHRPGRRYPLIVVQYDTRGFLRGGTGDEYPIQAFADRGYAVLSVSRPKSVEAAGGDPVILRDRRSTLSSVEAGVRLVVGSGVADPERIGLTGFSDGATTALFALLHSRSFAAVAISNCCIDTTLPTRVGPAAARAFHAQGYPRLTEPGDAIWEEVSIARNAALITTPLLVQTSDDELMSTLESITALREAEAPVDMYVFPGEHHVKWQPVHRLAVYRRALDWFDYWLRGIRSEAPERQADLAAWDLLKRPPGATPPP